MLGVELTGANWVAIALVAALYLALLITTIVFTADKRKKIYGWYKYIPVESPVKAFYFRRYLTHSMASDKTEV